MSGFFYRLRQTNWRRFFEKNGARTWARIEFTGFRERHDSLKRIGRWVGITNTGEHYYSTAVIDELLLISRKDQSSALALMSLQLEKNGRAAIDKYLLPDCRCRLGYHWKCGIHGKWEN